MWYYNGEQFKLENYPNDSLVGFVYEITEKDTGKKYKVKTPLQVYNICKKLKLFKN